MRLLFPALAAGFLLAATSLPAAAIEAEMRCGLTTVSAMDMTAISERLAADLPVEGLTLTGATPEYAAQGFHRDLACLLITGGASPAELTTLPAAEVVTRANDILTNILRSRADALLAILEAMKQARPELVLAGPAPK
jgi:hypothetical protein